MTVIICLIECLFVYCYRLSLWNTESQSWYQENRRNAKRLSIILCNEETLVWQTKDTLEMIKIITTGIRIVLDKLFCVGTHTHRNRQQFTWVLGIIANGTKIYVLDKKNGLNFTEIKSARILTRLLHWFSSPVSHSQTTAFSERIFCIQIPQT